MKKFAATVLVAGFVAGSAFAQTMNVEQVQEELTRHDIAVTIPADVSEAKLAEVMAYVYQLNHYLSQGGLPPEAPVDLVVPEGMDPGAATVH